MAEIIGNRELDDEVAQEVVDRMGSIYPMEVYATYDEGGLASSSQFPIHWLIQASFILAVLSLVAATVFALPAVALAIASLLCCVTESRMGKSMKRWRFVASLLSLFALIFSSILFLLG